MHSHAIHHLADMHGVFIGKLRSTPRISRIDSIFDRFDSLRADRLRAEGGTAIRNPKSAIRN